MLNGCSVPNICVKQVLVLLTVVDVTFYRETIYLFLKTRDNQLSSL